MTDLATHLDIQPNEDTEILVRAVQTREPTLITEGQVLVGSAPALGRTTVRRHRIRDAVRAIFASTDEEDASETVKTPKHYPRRYSFIEDASMSRMMDRL